MFDFENTQDMNIDELVSESVQNLYSSPFHRWTIHPNPNPNPNPQAEPTTNNPQAVSAFGDAVPSHDAHGYVGASSPFGRLD